MKRNVRIEYQIKTDETGEYCDVKCYYTGGERCDLFNVQLAKKDSGEIIRPPACVRHEIDE